MLRNTNKAQLRVGIIGMGPIGCTLAAHLIDAGAFVVPCDIDREIIDTIKKSGIHLEHKIEREAGVTDACYSSEDLQGYDLDLVAIAVKTPGLEKVLSALQGIVPERAFVMCAQNGLDNELGIAKIFGKDRTLRMVVNFAGSMSSPNTVHVTFFNPPNYIAALTPEGEVVANEIAGLLSSANLQTKIPDNIQHYVWEKAILNAALSPVCAVTGLTMKDVMDFPQGLELVKAIVEEAVRVAEAEGIKFREDFLQFCIRYLKGGGYHRPSMLVDLQNGLRTEIDYLNGRIVEYGRKHGLPTPYNQTITALVHMLEHASE
ncbi:MAG: ketopantoate reductase family protein [Candidatus Zixiibacteriota bacterium]